MSSDSVFCLGRPTGNWRLNEIWKVAMQCIARRYCHLVKRETDLILSKSKSYALWGAFRVRTVIRIIRTLLFTRHCSLSDTRKSLSFLAERLAQ